jgi:hypothetical protein
VSDATGGGVGTPVGVRAMFISGVFNGLFATVLANDQVVLAHYIL